MVIRGFLPLLNLWEFCLRLSGVNLSRISMSKTKVMCESTKIYANYGHCCSLQEFHFSWFDWTSRYEYRLTISSSYYVGRRTYIFPPLLFGVMKMENLDLFGESDTFLYVKSSHNRVSNLIICLCILYIQVQHMHRVFWIWPHTHTYH